ncbi:hypothetical protein DCAR_0933448 [Daucus carota subsp. sativus]|uniref:Uncharacterized protein n=1 Tax=Daucus carota subsp. sativus TaxID=79200 RepID=A0A175YDH6_DAUCS|nr:PREDICTED: peamaclein-like [Daucus carota subsp. sativus]WOH13935.1 hypothetical protein DCAR_0933448 [Daucus carota subsp. sativus]
MKIFLGTLVVFALLLAACFTEPALAEDSLNCGGKCSKRCSKAGISGRCLKYCGICCAKCKCVPSGTYGNKHECPCYRDMVSSKGKPKCP